MGRTSSAVKQKWNELNYRQIKIMISPKTAETFKKTCNETGQTMNGVLTRYIESFCKKKPHKPLPPLKIETRQQRKKSLELILGILNDLREAESDYLEKIPENLRNGIRYENSNQCIDTLDDAINILEGSF